MKDITILLATKSPFAAHARDAAVSIINSSGLKMQVLEKYNSKQELILQAKKAHALIVRSDKIDEEVLSQCPLLKLVIRGGAGYNNIDVETCNSKGIIVMNTPGQNSNAVAELALGLIFCVIRKIVYADMTTKAGEFQKSKATGSELKGKKIGLHGFGYIGQIFARKLHACQAKIYAYDPWISPEKAKDYGAELVKTPEELYEDADFISLHIPKNKNTEKSINYSLLSHMKKNGVLINTARAEIIDYQGLKKRLQECPDFRYAADVHPEGDVPGEKEMAEFTDQVILTPHIGASTQESNYNTAAAAAIQAVDFFLQGNMDCAVNKDIVPYWLQNYARLAEMLGFFCSKINPGPPREVQIICYNELEKYSNAFVQNVLKGIFYTMNSELTPMDAFQLAKQRDVSIKSSLKPNNSKGHGNAITIDYMVKDEEDIKEVSIRGTISDGQLKISRIKEYVNVDFHPEGLVVIFEYAEKEGMDDVIGDFFTRAGYNKIQGRFLQSPDSAKAISLFELEKKQGVLIPDKYTTADDEVNDIVADINKIVKEIINGYIIRFS